MHCAMPLKTTISAMIAKALHDYNTDDCKNKRPGQKGTLMEIPILCW